MSKNVLNSSEVEKLVGLIDRLRDLLEITNDDINLQLHARAAADATMAVVCKFLDTALLPGGTAADLVAQIKQIYGKDHYDKIKAN